MSLVESERATARLSKGKATCLGGSAGLLAGFDFAACAGGETKVVCSGNRCELVGLLRWRANLEPLAYKDTCIN